LERVGEIVAEIESLPRPVEDVIGTVSGGGPPDSSLTAREHEIVRLIAKGRSNQEIADELFISLRTAQTHVSNVLTKLELGSRAAVAAYAVRNGLA
jgi:NarL family two-component system response regulator LiaR